MRNVNSQSVFPDFAGNSPWIWCWTRQRLKRILWRHPRIYQPVGLLRGYGNVLARDFEILIDGHPRTANSFAAAAFISAQTQPVRVLSHRHTPAFVIAAVTAGKPVCLLIREPKATVVSWSIHSGWDLRWCLESYIDYYESVAPYRAGFCVADFPEVTTHFSGVIERINRMFGTGFATKPETQESIDACMAQADGLKRWADRTTAEEFVRRSSRPNPARQPLQQELQKKLSQPAYARLLEHGMRIYTELSQ